MHNAKNKQRNPQSYSWLPSLSAGWSQLALYIASKISVCSSCVDFNVLCLFESSWYFVGLFYSLHISQWLLLLVILLLFLFGTKAGRCFLVFPIIHHIAYFVFLFYITCHCLKPFICLSRYWLTPLVGSKL